MFNFFEQSNIGRRQSMLQDRRNAIKNLTQQKFNLSNPAHLKEIKKFVDEFEYRTRLAELAFSFICVGAFVEVASFLFLPMAAHVMVFGAGLILAYQVLNDPTSFDLQLLDMKHLYNWAMKGGASQDDYGLLKRDEAIRCDANLLKQDVIQKMLLLLVPHCKKDELIVWDKVLTETNAGFWGYLSQEVSDAFNRLKSASAAETEEGNRVHALKIYVESYEPPVSIAAASKNHFNNSWMYFKNMAQNSLPFVKKNSQNLIIAKMIESVVNMNISNKDDEIVPATSSMRK